MAIFTIEASERENFEKWLKEHDAKVRADAIDDYTEWLRKAHANFDEDYAEDIKSDYLDWLKEQK